jgi:DNA-binding NtrC family response regulator
VALLKTILYVDSDAEARLLMRELLAPNLVDVLETEAQARAQVRRRHYDLYIVAGGSTAAPALELCRWLQRIDGRTPIVFCSTNATARYQQAAIAAGAVRCLVKPLDPTMLRSTMGLLLKLAELESARALAMEQRAIHDHLLERSRQAEHAAAKARQQAQHAAECMLRAKAYRSFRAAGGNRANFERLWPELYKEVQRSF